MSESLTFPIAYLDNWHHQKGVVMIINFIFTLMALAASQTLWASSPNKSATIESRFEVLTSKMQPKEKRYHNILIGIVTPFESKVFSAGEGAPFTEQTIFEIGSVTKGFVGLALAQAVIEGKVKVTSSFANDTGVHLPRFHGAEIRWVDLANHTSTMPRVPDNLKPKNWLQPFLDYDRLALDSFLGSFKLPSPPGKKSDYSNTGAGLVGLGLEKVYDKSLGDIIQDSVTRKVNLTDTQIFLTEEQLTRITPVYLNGDQVPYWQWQATSVLQGAAAVKSTMNNMIKFLKVMIKVEGRELWPAVNVATQTTWSEGNSSIGLFWQKFNNERIIWHNGGTYGSATFVGYDPDTLVGVVALANTQIINENGVDSRLDIAALQTIIDTRNSLQISKPLKVIQDYDSVIEIRIKEFNKLPIDINNSDWVKAKLKHMVDCDQIMRGLMNMPVELRMTDQEKVFFKKAYEQRFYLMDWQNTQDMKWLLNHIGWFKISKWGKLADNQAWLLVQHADQEPDFQKSVLKILTKLYKTNETSPSGYAYLWDRVASSSYDLSKRKPQRYGTQGHCVGPGRWEPHPIEDERNVDKRRREVGLTSFAEYKQGFEEICK
jgi:CubicO group peptidase (beta-lactamase class C family)